MKFIILIICLAPTLLFAQQIERSTISSQSGNYENTQERLSYTIGETITGTLEMENESITQGFNQPSITSERISPVKDIINFDIYPNPASHQITFTSTESKLNQYKLFDMNGQLILNGDCNNCYVNTIDVESLAAGQYIMTLTNQNKHTESFKITIIK